MGIFSRYRRMSDFRRREKINGGHYNVYFNDGISNKYLTVHPFACEIELLKKINCTPEECIYADAYWNTGKDVSFLQVSISSFPYQNEAGFYFRFDKDGYMRLSAYIDAPVITRRLFEDVMIKFHSLDVFNSKKNHKKYEINVDYKT